MLFQIFCCLSCLNIYQYIPTVTWLAAFLSLASGLAIWLALSCGIWVEVVMEVSRGLQGHYTLSSCFKIDIPQIGSLCQILQTKKPCGAEPQPSYNTWEITLCCKPLSLWGLLLGPNLVRLTHSLSERNTPSMESTENSACNISREQ